MKSPISGILKRFSQVLQRAVDAVALYVIDNLDEDGDVKAVVEQAWLTYKISDVFMDAVRQAVKEACEAGYGQTIPLLPSQLEEAWDASGMTLSKKLHGADKEMRARVVGTIKNQLKQNRHAMQAARQLYDGYRSGQAVVKRQEMPKYLQDIVNFARRSELTTADSAQMLQLVRRARRQVALIGEHGAPNQALRTAYSELLNAVADGSEKALDRAVHVALEEKSRYVAERIARTEAARAWADGFHARYDTDDDVAAYKWTLSSRHPHYDICDLYAQANLWGLGPGIFPKDKTPILPVHPHCLCHLSLVYVTEIDMSRQRNQIKDGGDAYLKRQSHQKRCHLLGIDGAHAWEQGRADWRQYMRNWSSDFEKKAIVISSGGILEEYAAAEADAKRKYDKITKSGKKHFSEKISGYTGLSERFAGQVFEHVFMEKHILDDGVRKFDPDIDMAASFERLLNGNYNAADIVLLRHEHLERALEKRYNLIYREAHLKANKKYNYVQALREEAAK